MAEHTNQAPLIDLDKIMRERKSRLLHFFQPFISGYVKKIVHQDEINHILQRHYQKDIDSFMEAALFEEMGLTYNIVNEQFFFPDPDKRYIYVSNHPLGGLDGVLLIYLIKQKTGSAKAITNDLLLNLKNLQEVFIGVNLYGRKLRQSVKEINDVFKSNYQVLLFPAGFVSRRQKGVIRDLTWQPFFIKQAKKYKRDIIPLHVTGILSDFFYNFANIRKRIGIKPNLELFYLPNELFKQRNEHLTVTAGDAIPWQTFTNHRSETAWAAEIKNFVYDLGLGKAIRYEPGMYDNTR